MARPLLYKKAQGMRYEEIFTENIFGGDPAK
mgnify:CR=1 FL=1